jgi:serine protease Do
MKGEVVGINSQIYSRTGGYMGLSFAIPIEIAMHVAEQLKRSGKVARGWLGVMVREVTSELANAFGMRRPQGALIARVLPNGPAATAGLRSGDVVLEFAGQPIEISSALPPLVGLSAVGETVEIKLLRAGKPLLMQVTIGELPED